MACTSFFPTDKEQTAFQLEVGITRLQVRINKEETKEKAQGTTAGDEGSGMEVGGRTEATKEGACQSHCEFSTSSVKYEGGVAMT